MVKWAGLGSGNNGLEPKKRARSIKRRMNQWRRNRKGKARTYKLMNLSLLDEYSVRQLLIKKASSKFHGGGIYYSSVVDF